jgi:hypothetical protein
MPNNFTDAPFRNFTPIMVQGLSDDARKAVNAALEAMSTWRTETVENMEKNSQQVIEKMAAAARALGWPPQIIEATGAQLQSITKMQIQTMDQVMDTWEEQIKTPSPTSAMLSKLKSFPGMGQGGLWSNADLSRMATMNPFSVFMQCMEPWQKAFSDAMAFWTKPGHAR